MSFGHKYARGFAGIDDHLPPSDHDPLVHERIMPIKDVGYGSLGDTPSSAGSAPDMLHRFGINATQATLGVFTLMGTTLGNANPSAAGTQVVVKGAQNALNEIAAGAGSTERLQTDGILGAQTLKALDFQLKGKIGMALMDVPWITVYQILRNAVDTKTFKWTPLKGTVPAFNQQTNTVVEDKPQSDGLFSTRNIMIVGGGALLAALALGSGGKKKGGGRRRKGR
jgi:hypothetical protein